jgi:nucleoid DNA-binding protein
MANIAAAADVSKKQVAATLEALAAEIKKSLGSKGAGVIAIPGLVKIERRRSRPGRPRRAYRTRSSPAN